jgi:hypothetical protein
MGPVYAEITLKNAGDATNVRRSYIKEPEIRQTTVTALVDTGAAQAYGLTDSVQIHWKDRKAICQAVIIPNASDVLLGVIPLESMDLIINPVEQELTGAHGDKAVFRV